MIRIAKCSCQCASITLDGDPAINAVCHCADCRRRTGSAFGWSAYFRDRQVLERRGPLTRRVLPAPFDQERYFCASCGTTLCWTLAALPDFTAIAGGCFDDPPLPAPSLTVRNRNRCEWLTLPEGWATRFPPPP